MTIKRVQKKIPWTREDRARHQAIRESFADQPSIEALIDRGELTGRPLPLETYLSLHSIARTACGPSGNKPS